MMLVSLGQLVQMSGDREVWFNDTAVFLCFNNDLAFVI